MTSFKFLRYPGGKQRLLNYIIPHLPASDSITNNYIEPFVGGGAVFFAINPVRAILSDINHELIMLYRGIKYAPRKVWKQYSSFPSTKEGYYTIRDEFTCNRLISRAARILYLNRTCFKGMWRHNSKGEFNIGYGGQDRRWVINEKDLVEVSKRLKKVELLCADFEKVINSSAAGDFIFLDPPYKPHEKECVNEHFTYGRFTFQDHIRLSRVLQSATSRGVKWAMTTSSHKDILSLFEGNQVIKIPIGTGSKPGILTKDSGEVLIRNYEKV